MNTAAGSNRKGDFTEWIRELEDIKSSSDDYALKEEDVIPDVTDDEQDQAARFLKDVGFSALAQNDIEVCEIFELLTKKQKQTVRRRIDTVRHKSKAHHTDVRNIFAQQPSTVTGSRVVDDDDVSDSFVLRPSQIPPETEDDSLKDAKVLLVATKPSSSEAKDQEYGIPPPDYHDFPAALIQLGVETALSNSDLSNESKNQASSVAGRVSPYLTFRDQTVGHGTDVTVTQISDLGKKDLKMLRCLAAVELQTVFDEHGLSYTPHKSKKKAKDHGVFGVPLQMLLDRDRKNFLSDCNVPLFFQQLIAHLEKMGLAEEGIFRIPGGIGRMREIRQDIDAKWPRGKFRFSEIMIHDAAGLLKQFLRDLPDSLLTVERTDAFLKTLDVPDEKKLLYLLNLLVLMLPDVNRNTLQFLLRFLRNVVENSDNRMMLNSVAMIIAPNLFIVKTGRGTDSKMESIEVELQMAERTSRVVMIMIEHQETIFTIPSDLLAQIRQKNETRRTKFNIPVLGKKERSENYRATQFGEGVSEAHILVSLENLSSETIVPITETTTSNDVISRMRFVQSPKLSKKTIKSVLSTKIEEEFTQNIQKRNDLSPSSADSSVFLFEVGGNIGERRLDGSTNIMSVIQINPNAKFIVRQKPV